MKDLGKLYISPTPIGNLDDITIRTLNTLKEVNMIAAEDTRHTIKLLNYFDIKKSLISYHEHNKITKGPVIIDKLLDGEDIALVSDAGMPGISDPGEDLIKLAIENGIEVDVLPGATASILALILSGLSTEKFVFEGFLPSDKKQRKERLKEITTEYRTIILYEAPHRLINMLKDLKGVFGDRKVAVCRELTKKYQEVFRGNVGEALDKFKKDKPRGEFVIVLEGISKENLEDIDKKLWEDMSLKEHILMYMDKGFTKKDSVKKVAKERDIPKREVYKESIDI